MGQPRQGGKGKRSRSAIPPGQEDDADPSAKKLLASNRYASLQNGAEPPKIEKKEKMPPLYVKGFPEGLRERLAHYIEHGVKCTIRRGAEGYKLMTSGLAHYNIVKKLLTQRAHQFFTHDIETEKPLKAVLRGLHDMPTEELMAELKGKALSPVQIFKMRRHDQGRKYRDQLYLVHLERDSTNIKELQSIRTLFHTVVEWEKYKPAYRDTTQCMNCFMFGHGTRNCHMAKRCSKCGKAHDPDLCEHMEEVEPVCANCDGAHKPTSKACPKRAEYIEIRKRAAINGQPGRKRSTPAPPNKDPLPPSPPKPTPVRVPVLTPLPLNGIKPRQGPSKTNTNQVDQQSAGIEATNNTPIPGLSYAGIAAGSPINDSPLSTEQLVELISAALEIRRTCKTRSEQLAAVIALINNYGP